MSVDDIYRLTSTLSVDCCPTTKVPGKDPPQVPGTLALITLDLEVRVADPKDLAAAVLRVMQRIHAGLGGMLARPPGPPAPAPTSPTRRSPSSRPNTSAAATSSPRARAAGRWRPPWSPGPWRPISPPPKGGPHGTKSGPRP